METTVFFGLLFFFTILLVTIPLGKALIKSKAQGVNTGVEIHSEGKAVKNDDADAKIEAVKQHIQEMLPVSNPVPEFSSDNKSIENTQRNSFRDLQFTNIQQSIEAQVLENQPLVALPVESQLVEDEPVDTQLANDPFQEKQVDTKPENQIISINIHPDEIRSENASEMVEVPKGVRIKVKRIRIVEHTLNIEWATTLSGRGEIGIRPLLSASIQGEIQRVKGYISQQTESIEYEIMLDGNQHNYYKLIWVDIWLKGNAEIQSGNNVQLQPFQFRDRTELKVVPI